MFNFGGQLAVLRSLMFAKVLSHLPSYFSGGSLLSAGIGHG